jgi:tetratricopeptide (TPR) repeat protein
MIRMAFHRLATGFLSAVLVLACAATAAAQTGVVRGKVVDAQGAPVEGAKVTIAAKAMKSSRDLKTNKKGEFVQVGLFPGAYTITVEKEALKATQDAQVSIGDNPPIEIKLAAAAGGSAEQTAKAAALQKAFDEGVEFSKAGKFDESIAKFNEAIVQAPGCYDCYYNIGYANSQKKDWEQAEIAYKKAVELKPDHAAAWTGLANVYNVQKKTDLAMEATAKAGQYGGGGMATGGGANAGSLYNQGVILWNAQKYAEAKEKFEAAIKADPKYAEAWYLLGKAHINLGEYANAVTAFEGYLQAEPDGSHAAEVKKNIDDLKPLIKQ